MKLLTRLVGRFYAWLIKRENKQHERELLAAFPPETRIVVTSGCRCGREFVGQHGRVEGLSSFGGEAEDYRVYIDGDVYQGGMFPELNGKPRYQLMCGRALAKEASL